MQKNAVKGGLAWENNSYIFTNFKRNSDINLLKFVKMFPNSDVATMSRIPLRERVSRNKIHFEQMSLANHDKYTPLGFFFKIPH